MPETRQAKPRDAAPGTASPAAGDWELKLLRTILADIKSGRLQLPSLPDVALRVRDAVQNPNRSVADLTRIVQMDPALAARLVQVVNSPLYRAARKIDSCQSAITRLGLVATRNLVTSFTLRSLFRPHTRQLEDRLQSTWRHSCKVGAISSVLARLTRGLDPDRAMLGGLVHDIGELPVLQYLDQHPPQIDESGIATVLERLRGPLGTFVLKSWRFENDLARIPTEVESWSRDSGEATDYVDIVQVAHVHGLFGSSETRGAPTLAQLPAFRKLPISKLGPDASLELLEWSQAEINDVLRILHA